MKVKNVYTPETLHALLSKVFKDRTLPRSNEVLGRLQSVCGLIESEALQVQNEAQRIGLLCAYDQRKAGVFSFNFSYNGMITTIDTIDTTDITDTGVSRTAHNAPTPPKGMKKQSRYGKGSKETVLAKRKRATAK